MGKHARFQRDEQGAGGAGKANHHPENNPLAQKAGRILLRQATLLDPVIENGQSGCHRQYKRGPAEPDGCGHACRKENVGKKQGGNGDAGHVAGGVPEEGLNANETDALLKA